jgi:hypothetical protein
MDWTSACCSLDFWSRWLSTSNIIPCSAADHFEVKHPLEQGESDVTLQVRWALELVSMSQKIEWVCVGRWLRIRFTFVFAIVRASKCVGWTSDLMQRYDECSEGAAKTIRVKKLLHASVMRQRELNAFWLCTQVPTRLGRWNSGLCLLTSSPSAKVHQPTLTFNFWMGNKLLSGALLPPATNQAKFNRRMQQKRK